MNIILHYFKDKIHKKLITNNIKYIMLNIFV